MALRAGRPDLAERALPRVETATKALFALVAIGMTFARAELFLTIDGLAVAAAVALVAASVGLGRFATIADRGKRVALSCTSGIRNFALAILVAEAMYSGETQIVVMIYGLCMFLMTIGASTFYRSTAPPFVPAIESGHA
jgi:predicted Na+-dependent transporter